MGKEYGDDVLLLSSGFVLERVLNAADRLKGEGIRATAADINILYGKNPEKILEMIRKAKTIVTVEDHNINGGLGAYISRLVTENDPKYVSRIGLTTFGESGEAKPHVSDACKVAIGLGNRLVMREDWKRIWDAEVLDKVIATMLHPDNPQI